MSAIGRDRKGLIDMVRRRKEDIVQVNLRMREDLRQRLWREAEKSGRSFNQELVWRLGESLKREAVEDMLQEMHFLAVEQRQAMEEFRQMLKGGKK
jgi:hypothetical protein